ncbi:MAG: FAD-binding protein [Bacteroidales bacterium]|nr:FAD-binding protein [Bacteroidales bacterium]
MVKLYTDALHKVAYSTDASAYREIPMAVAYPGSIEDIRELVELARQKKTCIIPRAGGTSIAGQVVGDGIVADVSRHMNRILEINAEERWARVEPGVVRDELNLALKPYGLFFSPETSTSNRCCIGGMVGNNSCGTHSLVYGSTRDHVIEIKGVLSDGSPFCTSDLQGPPLLDKVRGLLDSWRQSPQTRKFISDGFPDRSLRRRSCGYAIDEALESPAGLDLCKLLCGSEGTFAFVSEIKLSLDPLPPGGAMLLCVHCDSMEAAFDANLLSLEHSPVAVELIDGKILELAKNNPEASRNRFFVNGDPVAMIVVEFNGEKAPAKAAKLEEELSLRGLSHCCRKVYGADVPRVWALRKAGLGVLGGLKGDAKPVGVVEDTAVAPGRLAAYVKDFAAMLDELGLDCVYYGHISTGELHLRPVINMKTEEGLSKFRQVACRTAELVRLHRGSLSGEHGDGRLRGEFIPLVYGEQCYSLMRELKRCFDPDGIFNTGKIIDTPPMDTSLRFDPSLAPRVDMPRTLCMIEQCNGSGDCRKSYLFGGTLCPSYMSGGRDELRSTRARANILREALSRGIDGRTLDSPEVMEVLSTCLACKGCRGECPSNVDMTRIRSEVLDRIHALKGVPFRSWMVARMAKVENLGACIAPLYNFAATWGPSSALIKKMVGFAPERSIPRIINQKIRVSGAGRPRRVYFFLDEFTRRHEPALAQDFVSLLEALGYQVIIPRTEESGRAAISKGCLDLARKVAERNVRLLKDLVTDDAPLVGIEPSCILSFRDEYPDLVPESLREDALCLSANSLLYDEFIMREAQAGNISSANFREDEVEIWLHGHCHQKALVGIEKSAAMLRLLRGAVVNVIPSGCCGMAGSFGYEAEHYRNSLEIGEMVLFPAVRKAVSGSKPAIVAAPGTSCRQQIYDGTSVRAVHPIEIMYKWLK